MKTIAIYEYEEDVKPILIIATNCITDWEYKNILNGRLSDIYFDNNRWHIEYFDNYWLSDEEVLIIFIWSK